MARVSGRPRAKPVPFEVYEIVAGESGDGYRTLSLRTTRGDVACRYYRAQGATRGTIWVGGVGGGWDSPARDLYSRLCRDLVLEGISSLRICFRHPGDLVDSTFDVLAAVAFAAGEGISSLALTGHSFGGAVVIQAAASAPSVRTVVALATQSYGATAAARLGPRCSLLLVHGTDDEVLTSACSSQVYAWAEQPKRLVLLPGAGHALDEAADEVTALIRGWVVEALGAAGSRA